MQKIRKKYDNKLEIVMNTMQKFPWNLDLKWKTYEFCKFVYQIEINIENKYDLMGQVARAMANL